MNSFSQLLKCISISIMFVSISGCGGSSGESTAPAVSSDNRNPRWAVPMKKPGLPNLHQVAPDIYRGAQPLPEGFQSLKAMGIKTVINFRRLHSDRDEMEKVGLTDAFQYFDMGMNTWDMSDERAAAFLSVVENKDNYPIFYHCQHGADRTGTMTAVYRIANQGWSTEDALDEMVKGGFGYHEVWTNLINYLKEFDTTRVRSSIKDAEASPSQTPKP